jgi:hypothetical protein
MKSTTIVAIGAAVLVVWIGASHFVNAQEKGSAQRYEFAVIKWDGNDKVCMNLPDRSEVLHVFESSASKTPKDMQDEEFCLAWTANKLAKDGWEVVTLDSRRLVFRRAAVR